MPATIIDGKAVAAEIRRDVAAEVAALKTRGVTPGLAVVLVGDDPASQVYVGKKEQACREVGIYSRTYRLPTATTEEEFLSLIQDLNRNPAIHGILVQLPLPAQIREGLVQEAIDPRKDVDGLHPHNMGLLSQGRPYLLPCTPAGVMELIRRTGVDPAGKRAVVIGRSNIVGKPTALLLLAANATVTVCHSRTVDLPAICREAEILVAAVGKPRLIQGDWIRPGAVVIDVGINRVEGRLVGDVDFAAALPVAGHLTPVPGGVGPMTIAMLMRNVVQAARAIALGR